MPQLLPITLQPPELSAPPPAAAPSKSALLERPRSRAGSAETRENQPIPADSPSFADRLSERIDPVDRTTSSRERDIKPASRRPERTDPEPRRERTDEPSAAQESELDAHETRTDRRDRAPEEPRSKRRSAEESTDAASRQTNDEAAATATTTDRASTADSDDESNESSEQPTDAGFTLSPRTVAPRSATTAPGAGVNPSAAAAPSNPADTETTEALDADAPAEPNAADAEAVGEAISPDQSGAEKSAKDARAALAFLERRGLGALTLSAAGEPAERASSPRQSRQPESGSASAESPVSPVSVKPAQNTDAPSDQSPDNQSGQQPQPQQSPAASNAAKARAESNATTERASASHSRSAASAPTPITPHAPTDAAPITDRAAPVQQPSTAGISSPLQGAARAPSIAHTSPAPGAKTADAQPADPAAAAVARGLSAVVNQKGGSLTLRLTPDSLGFVRVNMEITGGTVSARIEASTPAAHELLNANLGMLKQSLESRGLSVERLHVDLAAAPASQSATNNNSSNANASNDDRPGMQNFSHDAAGGRSRGDTGEGRDPRHPRRSNETDDPAIERTFTARLDRTLNAVA